MTMNTPYLELRDLRVCHGKVEALHGVTVRVRKGEIVAILGANGAGKTTTLTAISGLLKPSGGGIYFEGNALHTLPSHEIVRLGITHSPEGRRVFGTLTVAENLDLGEYTRKNRIRSAEIRDWIFDLFPRLEERLDQLAGTLSGGEQQMLAIARALMGDPKVLLLDEPSLGLAPILVRSIFASVREINERGVTVILVEQNARAALKIASRGYVMEVGKIVMEDTAENLLANPDVQAAYLGGGA
ncbi:leucine/isoleucine/valine transporter subunit; ATP-binding component of ABC superfamily [uncultured delta proteobacterium]|uniref:Leucine/isoleucine/valine transporter subunit ATP-binding component of ABC superfamily n=1 Tax=uncultured delta proteobacterium TaxID=34034 RepID=A0A212JD60_9DELT|nr:leucine/isoleucine/valine transporter subunit; ATP-binding component of ABC superfamily [uncultured delta proteobacterium]